MRCLTGYADDLTVHCNITSWKDLTRAHNMIADLLRIVRKYGFKVNSDKCHLMVKLMGTASARAHKLFSKIRAWRIGSTNAQEPFPQPSSFKYLGVYVSYGNQEKATLDYRLQEGNAKLQQVRRYVHNRRYSGPKSRLKIWQTTVWATVSAGLVDIGLTAETAQQLRSWYARKIRAVLNKLVHLTGVSTKQLYTDFGIKDPVQLLLERQSNRVRSLRKRQNSQTSPLLSATNAETEAKHCCKHCSFQTSSEQGLRIHEAKMHRDKLDRYIPTDFLPEHSTDGLPTCAACHKQFVLWKGLKDHLLSGACTEPETLRRIDAQHSELQDKADQTESVHLVARTPDQHSWHAYRHAASSTASLQAFCESLCAMWLLDA